MVKILKGESKVDMSLIQAECTAYQDGFRAGAILQADAVSDKTVRVDLNKLLEDWMADGNLEGDFEEFVKERIGK